MTTSEGKGVENANEVLFELQNEISEINHHHDLGEPDHKHDNLWFEATHKGNVLYEAEINIEQSGIYYVVHHVTALNLHVSVTQELNVE